MIDPDERLKEMLHDARMVVATSDDPAALALADQVNELHEYLSQGGQLPAAWRLPNDEIRMAQHDQLYILAWMLLQQPNNTLTIPQMELVAIDKPVVTRYETFDPPAIVFTLDPPVPSTILKEA